MRFVEEVITIRGGLPDFLGASCSGGVLSVPVVFVSISVLLRGAKKMQVTTAFGGSLTVANVETGLVDFLAVYEVSLRDLPLAFLYLREVVSLGHSTKVLFTTPFCPACALTLRAAFSSFSVTVYMP
jgi:hypothetical protein